MLHAGEEFSAVRGAATRFGGNGAQPADRTAFQAGRAGTQGHQRPLHRDGAEPAGVMQSFTKPHNSAETVQHAETLARGRGNQHAAIIGSEVQSGKCGAG